MPCASTGIGMLLTKRYLGCLDPYRIKSIWSRYIFPCMDLSPVVYIIWTLKPVNDLRRQTKWLSWCLRLVSLSQDILITGQFMTWKNSSKTLLFGICMGQLFTFCSNALTRFFLVNMNKDVKGTRSLRELARFGNWLVAGTFAKRLSVNNILHCS